LKREVSSGGDCGTSIAAGDISQFSLEAVARRAKVTRLTLYNQFGSRRGLLEAVFDERARLGGLSRIVAAMAMPDAREALDRIIANFCDFWIPTPRSASCTLRPRSMLSSDARSPSATSDAASSSPFLSSGWQAICRLLAATTLSISCSC
jgi:AcrR family transcriptional regulator